MSPPRRNPKWPNNDDLPHLQTLKGKFCRRALLWVLYALWVLGLMSFGGLSLFCIFCVVRTAVTFNAVPLPLIVQLYGMFVLLYEAYHFLTPGMHKWPSMRSWMRNIFNKYPYFRLNVCVFEEELERKKKSDAKDDVYDQVIFENDHTPTVRPDERAMYAFHPHGILSCGFAQNGSQHPRFANGNCRWLVADNLFWFPVLRDVLNWIESSNVTKETFLRLMQADQNICFIPGGFEEATIYHRGHHRVFLKKRFGFIKLALQFGYKIHPAYTFGEEYAYYSFPYLLNLRLKLNEFKIPGAVFFGKAWSSFMPLSDVDLITVVGKPLQFPKIENPTNEDVQKYHALYMKTLQDLFDTYKIHYAADPNATLEIY